MKEINNFNEIKEPIKMEDIDPNFKFEIANTLEGKTLLYCYQCGTCSSGCQSACADLFPHQIIRMALLGLRKEVLQSKSIWICTTCYDCIERCPQGVEVAKVLFAIKNIAVDQKILPKGLKLFAKNVFELGRAMEITDLQEDERDDLELPPIPEVDKESVQKMLKNVKFNELIDLEESEQE